MNFDVLDIDPMALEEMDAAVDAVERRHREALDDERSSNLSHVRED